MPRGQSADAMPYAILAGALADIDLAWGSGKRRSVKPGQLLSPFPVRKDRKQDIGCWLNFRSTKQAKKFIKGVADIISKRSILVNVGVVVDASALE